MTPFRKWQATRRGCADLCAAPPDANPGRATSGFTYKCGVHIESLSDGRFSLTLPAGEWSTPDLEHLERILFAWCVIEYPDTFGIKSLRVYRFLCELQSCIGLEHYSEMMVRNGDEIHADVCHSHDFCDANMCMYAALNNRMNIPAMNRTWHSAKRFMTV